MTRLPTETWLVTPRLDLPAYQLNTVCPVTGETHGLEDHHIWRRSFTALSREENQRLFWVEVHSGDTHALYRNRVALSADSHAQITMNRARLEYRPDGGLWYVESNVAKLLDLSLKLMADGEKVSKRRKKAATPEERRARKNFSIRTPDGEDQIIPELVQAGRDAWGGELGWSESVPAHYVVVAAFAKALQD